MGRLVFGVKGRTDDLGVTLTCLLIAIRLSYSVSFLPSLAKLYGKADVALCLSLYFTWLTCSEGSVVKARMSPRPWMGLYSQCMEPSLVKHCSRIGPILWISDKWQQVNTRCSSSTSFISGLGGESKGSCGVDSWGENRPDSALSLSAVCGHSFLRVWRDVWVNKRNVFRNGEAVDFWVF